MYDWEVAKIGLVIMKNWLEAIKRVSDSNDVHLNGLLKYSKHSDNTATQEYTVRVMYNANNTPLYMQTACNLMQVGARSDRSPPALIPDCLDSTPCSSDGGFNESS